MLIKSSYTQQGRNKLLDLKFSLGLGFLIKRIIYDFLYKAFKKTGSSSSQGVTLLSLPGLLVCWKALSTWGKGQGHCSSSLLWACCPLRSLLAGEQARAH